MSWNANRFTAKSDHHIPPRHPAFHLPVPVKKKVSVIDHRAYHQLFQNAGSYEECEKILRWWWTIKGQFIDNESARNLPNAC
jgi:hypothetical protein